MTRKIFRVVTWGGLGDVLLSTPTFHALKKADPSCKIIVFCIAKKHRDVYKNNPDVDRITNASFFRNPWSFIRYYMKWAEFHSFRYGQLLPSLFYKRKVARLIAEQMFGIALEDEKLRVYLTEEEEKWGRKELAQYRNPVIIHISSIASKNQEWPLSCWNDLISQMPEYSFIQLGLSTEEKVENAIDLRGKTSFRQALALIKYAKSFIGVVSSFSHATNAFDTPGVVLFGASSPEVWGHANNINLFRNLPCSPCIDLLGGSACPYDKRCLTDISVEAVKQSFLKQVLKKNNLNS